MGSGSNGVSAVPEVVPYAIEEPESSLLPQTALQRPSEDLFGGQRIFLHAPQYHWHVQGAAGVDDEARQQVVALAEQMYRFGHRTETREMELWGRMQNTMESSGIHQLLAQLEQNMKDATSKFAGEMYAHVNDSVGQVEKTLAAYWEETRGLQQQVPVLQQQDNQIGSRMDMVEKKLEDIRVAQIRFATDLVDEARKALSVEIDQKVTAVRAEFQQQVNQNHQYLQETLREIKHEVATMNQSQDRMWEVISRMGEDIRGITESTGSGNLSPIPESHDENPDVPLDDDAPFGQPNFGPSLVSPIPNVEEEISSVKDSVTSGVAKKSSIEGSTGGLGEQLVGYTEELTPEHTVGKWEFEFGKPETSAGPKGEKGGDFILDPMTSKMSAPVDYSATASDTVSLVGKGPVMSGPSPGGYMPQTAGVGQMKLEAPPRYSGKKQPSVRTWLSQMERYMRLMKYAPTDWLDVVAMRVDGAASSWVTAVLQEIADGRRQAFRTWGQFKVAMIHRFESITETEDARRQLRALKQTGRVSGYIQKFQELQYRLPSMTDEEAFHAFLSGLVPHLQEHVGAHVQGDLE